MASKEKMLDSQKFTNIAEHLETSRAVCSAYSGILLGWETEKIRKYLSTAAEDIAKAIKETEKLADDLKRRGK